MNKEIHEDVLRELECLTNKCITGDVTVAVFDILKKTDNLESLLKTLGVEVKKKSTPKPSAGSMFDQLLSMGVKLE